MGSPCPLWDQPDPFLDHLPWASEGFHSSFTFIEVILEQ